MKINLIILFSIFCSLSFAQNKLILSNTFYKEKFIQLSKGNSTTTFFPANEQQLNLNYLIRDSSKQYTDLAEFFYKHHLIEIKRKEGYINISPLLNLSKGRYNLDSTGFPMFRNTRGIYVEGQLINNVSFNFVFSENQARFQPYEQVYFNQRGELYDFGDHYSLQNAVIPGGSRTKPFKVNGYDYAFSSGVVRFSMTKKISIEAGNNSHFIGSGYRSLLLSDNSFLAPNFKFHWQIHPKWSYEVLYQKNLNLYRKPTTKAVEANYETKIFALTYLTFKPMPSLSFSLFTSGNQLQGDSLIRHSTVGNQLIPLPLLQNDILTGNSKTINGITGLNIDWALKKARIYSQLVLDKFESKTLLANQLGFYLFDAFTLKNVTVQLEWNQVPKDFYAARYPKLSYSHFNLPAAHPKGNNFNELFVKLGYELGRWYLTSKTNFYFNQGGDLKQQYASNSIYNTNYDYSQLTYGTTILQDVELGLRFNRTYNGNIYFKYQGRASQYGDTHPTYKCIWFGFKTSLFNEYFDL